ncbi:MAG: hypothetical protein KUG82_09755 [Pseudomonadales bacterium]|nr:hypothetical protein [Pseudomonadales bacterium]
MATLPASAKSTILSSVNKAVFPSMGVVVDVNGVSQIIREPSACFSDTNYIVVVVQVNEEKESSIDYTNMWDELGLAGINCTAAVVAGVVTFGSGAASPFTGGTSLALTAVSYSATIATGTACAVSAIRTINSLTNPEINEVWDNSTAYQTSMTIIDGVSLLGVGASVAATVKVMKILKQAGVSIRSATTGAVNRAGRKQLAKATLKVNRPGATAKELKQALGVSSQTKRLPKNVVTQGMVKTLRDSFAAGLSFFSSAFDGNIKSITFYLVKLES